jgi:hypothetical protein
MSNVDTEGAACASGAASECNMSSPQHAVDVLMHLMNLLSGGKTQCYQRNGAFCVVAPNAFGQLNQGVRTHDYQSWERKQKKRSPELEASFSVIEDKGITPSWKGRFDPILYGADAMCTSLEAECKTYGLLRADAEKQDPKRHSLFRAMGIDDGQPVIPLISHDSRYHSHKYGYACDGTDVWVSSARVMDLKKYLTFLRQFEADYLKAISGMKLRDHYERGESYAHSVQDGLRLPTAFVLTPELMISLPLSATLRNEQGKLSSTNYWTPENTLSTGDSQYNCGMFANFRYPSTHDELPFGIHVYTNIGRGAFITQNGCRTLAQYLAEQQRQFGIVEAQMPVLQPWLGTLNSAHHKACQTEIDEYKRDFPKSAERDAKFALK